MAKQDFYNKMLPYAQKVKDLIGQPVTLTLAQWAVESGYGTSDLAKNPSKNNYGGIKYSKYSVAGTVQGTTELKYANYPSIDTFVQDYVRVMKLSFYDGVRAKYGTPGIEDDIIALDQSPYAESSSYTKALTDVIKADKLTGYEGLAKINVPDTAQSGSKTILSTIEQALKGIDGKYSTTEMAVIGGVVLALYTLIKK